MTMSEDVGREVRRMRRDQDLTQKQLAERIGTAQSVIARLESGTTEPTLKTLQAVGVGLGRPLLISWGKPEDGPEYEVVRGNNGSWWECLSCGGFIPMGLIAKDARNRSKSHKPSCSVGVTERRHMFERAKAKIPTMPSLSLPSLGMNKG